jgi:hypothetical protein
MAAPGQTDEAMSPLRRRMIEDMTIRKLAQDPTRLHPHHQWILLRSSADRPTRRASRTPTLSTASGGERRAHPDSQSYRGFVAVLLQDHAQALRHHRAHDGTVGRVRLAARRFERNAVAEKQ